jgi:hypothetical protein
MFGLFVSSGMSLSDARASFNRVAHEEPGCVAVSPSLWVLSDEYGRLELFASSEDTRKLSCQTLVIQQVYSGLLNPPTIASFELVEDKFNHDPCRLLGVQIGRTIAGYGFAVYRRTHAAVPARGAPPQISNSQISSGGPQ